LATLGNLYWTVGYLDAARIWRDLASTFGDAINKDSDNSIWRDKFCVDAAENIYRAEALSNQGVSQHISTDLYGKKGGLQEVYEFKDWDSGVDMALELLNLNSGDLVRRKMELKDTAKEYVETLQKSANMLRA
jgi:hypothetical protein